MAATGAAAAAGGTAVQPQGVFKIYDYITGCEPACDFVRILLLMNRILMGNRTKASFIAARNIPEAAGRLKTELAISVDIYKIYSRHNTVVFNATVETAPAPHEDFWHGTTSLQDAISIAKYGLQRMAKNPIDLFGKGIYAAREAVWVAMRYANRMQPYGQPYAQQTCGNSFFLIACEGNRMMPVHNPTTGHEKFFVGTQDCMHPDGLNCMADYMENPSIFVFRHGGQLNPLNLVVVKILDENLTPENILTLEACFKNQCTQYVIADYLKRKSAIDAANTKAANAAAVAAAKAATKAAIHAAAAALPALPPPPAPIARKKVERAVVGRAVAGAMQNVVKRRRKIKFGVSKWPGEKVKKRKTMPVEAAAAQAPAAAAAAQAQAVPGFFDPTAANPVYVVPDKFNCVQCGIAVRCKGTINSAECNRTCFLRLGYTATCCGCEAFPIRYVGGKVCDFCEKRALSAGKAKAQPQAAPAAVAGSQSNVPGRSGGVGSSAGGSSAGGSGAGGSGGGGGSRQKGQGMSVPASVRAPMPAAAAAAPTVVDLTVDSRCTTPGCCRFTQYDAAEACCPVCVNGVHTWWCNDTEKARLASGGGA